MLRPRWAGAIPRVSSTALTYEEVGYTRKDELPPYYKHLRRRVRVGNGQDVFIRAGRAVRVWAMQFGAKSAVHPALPATTGLRVVVSMPFGPVVIHAPCMVVWAIDEQTRSGFAYGTLPGHPLSGEEAFVVEIDEAGEVFFTVTAFSRPSGVLGKVAWPLIDFLQGRIVTRYLRGVVDASRV